MARGLSRRVRQILTYLFVSFISTCGANQINYPEFYSLSVLNVENNSSNNANFKKIEFQVHGRNIHDGMHVKATKTEAVRNAECREDLKNYNISEIWTTAQEARYVFLVPQSVKGNIYLCLPRVVVNNVNNVYIPPSVFGGSLNTWHHQGENVTIRINETVLPDTTEVTSLNTILHHPITMYHNRIRRQEPQNKPKVYGLRLDKSSKEPSIDKDSGVPELLAKVPYTIRLFGENFSKNMVVTFTENKGRPGTQCFMPTGGVFQVQPETIDGQISKNTVRVVVSLPTPTSSEHYYICASEAEMTKIENVTFIHQGTETWLRVQITEQILPMWASIMIICICLSFSALFSGLNLGLMSLDRTELKILCNTGTPKEREYAKAIQPVRNHGNYLLCSILLGNVLVNSIFTILLDGLTSGLIAVVFSTLAIVIFGEITPQAICSRHGLAVGARTIYITKLVMLLTAPLAYPISKLLDRILGEEIGNVYNRERLKELVKVTTGENDLDKDEVNIISGALELRKKTVAEVMTKIEDVFMLDYDAILDFETVSEIMKSGYSRIPVYEDNRNNIVTMLYIKDLAFVDPDDNTPLKTLCQFYQNPCNFVFEDVTLDVMFRIFKEGNKGHMAFVHRVNSEGEGDPFYETIGLITLEDVIEELIQAEIMDETDVFTDNRTKRRRNADRTKQDFTIFAEKKNESKVRISPQLTLATYQYLSTSVDPFKPEQISETILRRLLKQEIWFHIKKTKDWRNDPATLIYQQGKAVDYFVLIVEGRVEVTVGQENLMFESGPFTFFGIQALSQNIGIADSPTAPSTIGSLQSLNMDSLLRYTFQPDYSVRAATDVLYMKIRRNLYFAAKRATLMERSQRDTTTVTGTDQFDDEVEKLLHSLEDDGSIGRTSPEPRFKQPENQTQTQSQSTTVNGPMQQQQQQQQQQQPNSTSKSASPRSAASPSSPHLINVQDTGKPAKKLNEDGIYTVNDIKVKEEEVSLLPKK
ncbi:hypothetical protein ILUMI_11678 [Ignelater luminosus]|uniref:Metal transporter CNNM4 n=1 Tax=Ignelater luminosus TaxID=2038154 RepID=A0A8K0GDP5_IGNLU|nr:hypothetical protein ILUMI_11678 [Ignelater luminosus]